MFTMTQFTNRVERQKQRLALEKWSKEVKQLYAHDGMIETWYNNGDIHYEENKPKGRKWIVYAKQTKDELIGEFNRFEVDQKRK
jgi:hypothetical protein